MTKSSMLYVLNAFTKTKSETCVQWASTADTQANLIAGTVVVCSASLRSSCTGRWEARPSDMVSIGWDDRSGLL